jgi:lipoprotein LprG
MSRLRSLLVVLSTALIVTGCSNGSDSKDSTKAGNAGSLPAATDLLAKSSTAMTGVTSVAFNMTTEGTPPIPIKSIAGDLLKNGDSQGTLTTSALGSTVEVKYVLLGEKLYAEFAGSYRTMDKSTITSVMDPSAILDPARGIPLLLTKATGATSEAKENGSVRIGATLPAAAVKGLGVNTQADVKGQVWISESDNRLTKVRMVLPGGAVIMTLADYNKNPSIKAPA